VLVAALRDRDPGVVASAARALGGHLADPSRSRAEAEALAAELAAVAIDRRLAVAEAVTAAEGGPPSPPAVRFVVAALAEAATGGGVDALAVRIAERFGVLVHRDGRVERLEGSAAT
jgi:hypothetical protein